MSKSGIWIWDQFNNGVIFKSSCSMKIQSPPPSHVSVTGKKNLDIEVRMLDTIDEDTEVRFKKFFQRKVKSIDSTPQITIQDVKNVAIFMTKVENLTPAFISCFHTMAMDRFLRSMIVYFQYYMQIWDRMQQKRIENARKLRLPITKKLENEIKDNLSDLRSVAARNYACLLLGMEDSASYHHMSNKNNDSLSDRDRHLYEMLYPLTVKVIWIGLFRKNYSLIEKETNRLFRSLHFSLADHSEIYDYPKARPDEEQILIGTALKNEQKLSQKSPIIEEIINADHEYDILSIGIRNTRSADKRARYLEIAYVAPEEYLVNADIAVGVLGIDRKYLDVFLRPHKLSTTIKRDSMMKIGKFDLPKKSKQIIIPCGEDATANYNETILTKQTREEQCKMWRKYVKMNGFIIRDGK